MAPAGSNAAKDYAKKDQPEKVKIQSDFSLGSVKSAYFLGLARKFVSNTCSIMKPCPKTAGLATSGRRVAFTLSRRGRRRYLFVITNCQNRIDMSAAACNSLSNGQHGPLKIRGKK